MKNTNRIFINWKYSCFKFEKL